MSYIGVDVGTTGCKAVVFDAGGQVLASAYREYPLLSPQPGWAEIDSVLVCRSCRDVIREAAQAASRDPVRGLAISCQGEAFTPVADDGRFLANGMVSSDSRAQPLVGPWSREFGVKRLYEITGHTPYPIFTLYKMLWLHEHRPEVWREAAKFYCFEELLQHKLGLEPAISWSLAGRTMLFDVRRHTWSNEILSAIELEPARLARPAASGTPVGTIPTSVARELGLPDGVVVVSGGHDQPAGALGAGVVRPGQAMYATGTVECICPAFNRPQFDESLLRNNVCTYDYTLDGMYTSVLYSLTGGNLLRWFRDQWGQSELAEAARSGRDVYDLLVASMAADPTDLLVLPYFTPSGTPYFDTNVPGAILGLRLSTSRGQVLRALLEGVALEMRLNVDLTRQAGLEIDEFRATGGGAKNPAMAQLKADVLDRPITTLAVTEAGCLGVAMLACAAHTGARPEELVNLWVKPRSTVEPDRRRAAIYNERFKAYKEFYPAMRELRKTLGL